MIVLTEDNLLIYAAMNYLNPNCCTTEEFMDDLKRVKYIKKLFGQYKKTGTINERLILNHIVILYNVFEARACTRILFLKLEEHLDCLKPFLEALSFLPRLVDGVKEKGFYIVPSKIQEDRLLAGKLRKILKEGTDENKNG